MDQISGRLVLRRGFRQHGDQRCAFVVVEAGRRGLLNIGKADERAGQFLNPRDSVRAVDDQPDKHGAVRARPETLRYQVVGAARGESRGIVAGVRRTEL